MVTLSDYTFVSKYRRDDDSRDEGTGSGTLGGFIVDAAEQHIRYLVVRRPGLFGKTGVLPFSTPRVDLDGRAIEIDVNDQELWQLRNLRPDVLIA
jgi:hypothetical protein